MSVWTPSRARAGSVLPPTPPASNCASLTYSSNRRKASGSPAAYFTAAAGRRILLLNLWVRATLAKKATKGIGRKSTHKVPGRTASAKPHGPSARPSTEAQSIASRLPEVTREQTESAKRKFEQGVVARGEAVEAGKPLPPGATHEIIGYRPDGSPILKRKRFSMR